MPRFTTHIVPILIAAAGVLAPSTAHCEATAHAELSKEMAAMLTPGAVAIIPAVKGDPMDLSFFERDEKLSRLGRAMEAALEESDYKLAADHAKAIIAMAPGDEQRTRARVVLELAERMLEVELPEPPKNPTAMLQLRRDQILAVSVDSDDAIVMIGPDILRVGDAIPGLSGHVVDSVSRANIGVRVSNEYETRRFEIPLLD